MGRGNSITPLAADSARGTPLQETILSAVLMAAAALVLISLVLIRWGPARRHSPIESR